MFRDHPTHSSSVHNIVSMSGGKDSTATALLAIVTDKPNIQLVFADTGHEHPLTYEYLDYLSCEINIPITTVKADFSFEIERKRQKLINGDLPGWTDQAKERAIDILKPTGIPFLDLCMWKGRFPSTKARFCTSELKRNPLMEQVFIPLMDQCETIYSWQGIRREESAARRDVLELEEVGQGLNNYRPIADWNVKSVFDLHDYMGIKPNPLYKMGMSRVGCMPCVNCRKDELRAIALRAPEEVERVREWEQLVSLASRRESATFFPAVNDPMVNKQDDVHFSTHGIDRHIDWAMTARGGRIYDLIAATESADECSSAYGLCE